MNGYLGAVFKGFSDRDEAQTWLESKEAELAGLTDRQSHKEPDAKRRGLLQARDTSRRRPGRLCLPDAATGTQ